MSRYRCSLVTSSKFYLDAPLWRGATIFWENVETLEKLATTLTTTCAHDGTTLFVHSGISRRSCRKLPACIAREASRPRSWHWQNYAPPAFMSRPTAGRCRGLDPAFVREGRRGAGDQLGPSHGPQGAPWHGPPARAVRLRASIMMPG